MLDTHTDRGELNKDNYVTIGGAAELLGVSIDTVRRWDKSGKIHSKRLNGKNRFFLVDDINAFKSTQPLSTSGVARLLKISPSSVRRLELNGYISAQRNSHGKRLYDPKNIEEYLESKNQSAIPIASAGRVAGNFTSATVSSGREFVALENNFNKKLSKVRFRPLRQLIAYGLAGSLATITILSIAFLIFPHSTGRLLGYIKDSSNGQQQAMSEKPGLLVRTIRPLANAALNIVGVVSPTTREKIYPEPISGVTYVLSRDDNGNIVAKYTFSPSRSSYSEILNKGLMVNLNSEFVQGYKPGESKGSLAILPITGMSVEDGSLAGVDIANGAIKIDHLSSNLVSYLRALGNEAFIVGQVGPRGPIGPQGPQGPSGTDDGDIGSVFAGLGLMGGGNSGNVTLNVSTGKSIEIISDGIEVQLAGSGSSVITSSVSGLEISPQGLRLLGGCVLGEVLKWNGTTWGCNSDNSGSGSVIDVAENGTNVTTNVTVLDFNAFDFVLSNTGSQADIALDYTNSGITRRTATEVISGNWSFKDSGFKLQDDSDNTKQLIFEAAAITSGTTRTLSVPNVSGTIITNGNLSDVSAVGTITTGVWQGLTIGVQYGGTGATGFTSNGVIYGNGAGALQVTASGTAGQVLIANGSGVPLFTNLSGDLTVNDGGVTSIDADAIALGTDTTGSFISALGALTGLGTTGNSGEDSTPTLSVLYGSITSTAVQGNTQVTCVSGTGNLSGGGTVITLGAGGTCGAINTINNPSFNTSVTTPLLTATGALQIVTQATVGSDDIIFDTAGLEKLRILENGSLFFERGTDDVTIVIATPSGAPATYTFSGLSGAVLTSGNYVTTLDGIYVNVGESPVVGDITGSFSDGLTVAANSVTLATDTTGDFIASLGTLTGLSVTGNNGEASVPALSVVYGSVENTAVQGNTQITVSAGTNLNGGGAIIIGAGGTVTLNTVANPSFGTSVTSPLFTNAGALTLSTIGAGNDLTLASADRIVLTGFNCSTFNNGGALTVSASGVLSCDHDDGGAAGSITGAGTTNRIPLYTGASSVGDSWLLQNGSTLQIDNNRNLELIGGNLTLTSGSANISGTLNGQTINTSADFTGTLTVATGITVSAGGLNVTNSGISSAGAISGVTNLTLNGAISGGTTYSGSGNINTTGGSLQTSNTTRIGNDGSLQNVTASTSILTSGTLGVARGGSGVDGSAAPNGSLLIGNGAGFSLAALTQGSGINIANGVGSIAVAATLGTSISSVEIDTDAVNLGSQSTGDYVSALGTLTGLLTGGNSGEGSTPTLSVSYGSSANTAVQGNITITCSSGTGELSGGGNTITLGTGGTCSDIAVSESPTFNTSVTTPIVQNNGTITIGANTTPDSDDIVLATGGSEKVRLLENGDIKLEKGVNDVILTFATPSTNATYTFFGATGIVLTDANYATYLDGIYVNINEAPISGDITGSYSDGFNVGANTVSLNTDTVGDYVQNLGSLTGLSTTANIGESSTPTLSVVYGSSANTSVQGNTTIICTGVTGSNLSGGDTNITLGNGGTCGDISLSATPTFDSVAATTFTGDLLGNASIALALAANPSDCAANQFTIAIEANGNLTCSALTDADIPDVLTIGASGTVANGALSVSVSLLGSSISKDELANSGVLGFTWFDSEVSDTITIGALGSVNDAALSSNVTKLGTGIDLGTGEVTGNLLANRLQNSGVDLGAANVTIDLSNTNGAFVTNLTIDGTITAMAFSGGLSGNATTASALAANPADCSANQFATVIAANGSLTCAALTDADIPNSITIDLAAALAANPTDCAVNQFSNAIAANGDLTCAVLMDADVPDALTIGASSTVADGSLSANVTKLGAIITKDELTNSGTLGFTWSDSEVSDTITIGALGSVNDAALSSTVTKLGATIDLATTEVSGNLRATNLQNAAADLGAADVNINLGNTNGAFNTSMTLDGILTASEGIFSGTLQANGSGGIISTQATLVVNAGGTVDIQDVLTVDNLTIDTGGVSIATNQAYTGTGAVTVSSGGAGELTLDSASNVLILAATDTTIQRTAAGTTTLDLNNAAATILALNNAGVGTASLTVEGSITAGTGLTVVSGGITIISGGLNVNSTGITNVGSITGVGTNITGTGAVTLESGGTGALILDSASNVLILNDATIRRTASGTSTIDIVDGSNTTLTVDNSGAGVANVNVTGVYQRNGTNGATVSCSSNQFLGTQVVSGGIVTSGTCESDDSGISDSILKADIITHNSVLNKIKDLDIVDYRYRCEDSVILGISLSCGTRTGILAQDLALLFPELIFTRSDGYLGFKEKSLMYYGLSATAEMADLLDGDGNVAFDTVSSTTNINTGGVYKQNGVNGISVSKCANNQYLGSGVVVAGGIITGGSCRNDGVSDERIKKNIEYLEDGVLEALKNVNAVSFDFRCDEERFANAGMDCFSGRQTGVIAQELAEIFPDLVFQDENGYYNVKYQGLSIYTLKAVNELAAYIDSKGVTSISAPQDNQTIDLNNLSVGSLNVSLDLFTQGGLIVSGPAEFRGVALFDQLVTFGDSIMIEGNLTIKGTAMFNNSFGGYAVMNEGQQSVRVSFERPFTQPPVITISLGDGKFANYSYDNVTENGFDILLEHSATQELKFSWTAISINNPKTFVKQ